MHEILTHVTEENDAPQSDGPLDSSKNSLSESVDITDSLKALINLFLSLESANNLGYFLKNE